MSAIAFQGSAGPYRIDLRTDPAVVPVGNAKLLVALTDSTGKPVADAVVKVLAQMPSMPMGEREQTATPVQGKPGVYQVDSVFAMAGSYNARISISGPAGAASTTIIVETGQDSAESGAGLPVLPVALVLLVLALSVWIFIRLRRVGVKPDVSGLAHGRIVGWLAFLALVIAGAVWAVSNLRRPGSMTPLAAQGMAMSTPPPPGTAAVTLATVKRGTIESTVRYTGQVVGYVEQDLFPRVTGALVYMPLYVGDSVHRGQVLARLDVSQLAPQVAEKRSMEEAAAAGLASSRADYNAASAMLDQASAEHDQFMAAIDEATANLSAAQENETAMAAQLASAEADAQSAVARRNSAQADETFWQQELGRMDELFKAKALSRSEYQETVSQEAKARAALAEMQSDLSSARAKISAASATVRQADAGVVAAQRKLAEAKSEMRVHRAHVVSAQASRASAHEKVAQADAGLRQAAADVEAAVANEGYATITSPIDGVVIQRNVTQGTLVQPGISILRIAQIDPIRIQANVPASDLERVRLGARVRIWDAATGRSPVEAAVTSISPSVDPTGRIGVVEALVRNPKRRLMPGQFDSMNITTGSAQNVLIVPNEAVQEAEGGSYVWVAEPVGVAGQYAVRRVPVQPGVSDGQSTAIPNGLQEGQKVVTSGFVNLQEGFDVSETAEPGVETPSATPMPPGMKMPGDASGTIIHVGTTAFEPSTVTLTAGEPAKITFLRTTEQTCATEVIFPELGIRKALPLNQPVTIDLGPGPQRTICFECGMKMLKGQVVVR